MVPILIIKIESIEIVNNRFLKMDIFKRGYFNFFSCLKKIKIPKSPASSKYLPKSPLVRFENPCTNAIIIKKNSIEPKKSNFSPLEPAQSDLTSNKTIDINKRPKITLKMKILLHPRLWIKNPPKINPLKIPV